MTIISSAYANRHPLNRIEGMKISNLLNSLRQEFMHGDAINIASSAIHEGVL